MLVPPATLAAVGFVSSFTNGVLGAGGAILFIPLALYALPLLGVRMDPHVVATLSLTQGICAFAAGGLQYARRGQVDYRQLWRCGPPLGAGGLAGGLLSASASARLLVLLFAVVTSVAALLLLIPPREASAPPPGRQVLASLLLGAVGALGGAVGVGAGVLVIPILLYVLGTEPRTAAGTGLVLPVFISAPAFVGKVVTDQVQWAFVPVVAVVALVGAAAGSRVTLSISAAALRLGLSGLTAALALTVWVQLARG